MMAHLCNCDRYFSSLHTRAPPNPSFPVPICHYPNLPLKPLRQRYSVSAAAAAAAEADKQTLPQSAIRRIAEKLRSLGYVEETINDTRDETSIASPISPGEIFVPSPTQLPKYRVGHTLDPSWSTPENPVPEPGSGNAIKRFHELRRRVLKEEEEDRMRKRREGKRESAPSLAELKLPEEELRRLRSIGIELKKKLKVGKAGITEGIVNGIHERWRRSELVKITCEDICRLNMKRTHELLERKTGGLVIWRSGSNIILYRGSDYKYPYFFADDKLSDAPSEESRDLLMDERISNESGMNLPCTYAVESPGPNSSARNFQTPLVQGVGSPNRVRFQLAGEAQLAEEADTLLEGLGPRFNDWWGYNPLPVDADLLPAVVPGYKRPFRLLPYGVKPKLTNDEMTTLRRLARPLPCHFALGRNRKHQGLAAAVVKLWEKCEIVKIAVKRGVQNTNSELMAEELKWLTGGTLLSRDREFIVFYRGKDFLPAAVSSAIEERRKYVLDASKSRPDNPPILNVKEHKHETDKHAAEVEHDGEIYQKLQDHSEGRKLRFLERAVERTSTKLSMALEKKARAEKLLSELEKEETSQPPEIDKEGITEEERYMLRKVGLRMKAYLLLGRRGVFAGTVENMHLHWKYRELVKVCIGRRSIEEVHGIARTLEAESGGILVAVEPVSKGYAIIVYRGKNYKRPASLRPRTLLTKREALKHSLEAQRRESLKLHVLELSRSVDELKLNLAKDKDTSDRQMAEDVKVGFDELEIDENSHSKDEMLCKDPESHPQYYVGDSTHECAVKGKYLFGTTEPELRLRSTLKETTGFWDINEQSGNAELQHHLRSQDRTSSSTTGGDQPYSRDSDRGYQNAQLEPSVQNAASVRPSEIPLRTPKLSNRERLLLRKQALKMKKQPVLALGKSNVVTGVAKAIKAHFKKHPLAIVNVKGRATGTSVQEAVYNLEQATGAVLVSQEPSKVILYRGWGSGLEPEQACGKAKNDPKNYSLSGEVKARPVISPELMSAIRLECGLKSLDEENASSEAPAAGSTDTIPN